MMTVKSRYFFPAATLALFCIHANLSHAQVTFDWATVGNPGNAGEVQSQGTFGAVADVYRISKHAVTNHQYTEFLNAVADTDTNGLYSLAMAIDASGGILRSGVSGSFSYAVKPGQGNNPVVYVSFFDAMRFANWLENGQPVGTQMLGTTEDGVYAIGTSPLTRASGATFFIPSEDEWYKAAYHQNDGVTGNYFDYPTNSDTIPTSEAPAGGSNSANYRDDATGQFAVPGSNSFLTDVGAYATSTSPYGTFDQGGNVSEWNESGSSFRGGSWGGFSAGLAASGQSLGVSSLESSDLGFRVASIPEPSSGLLVLLATVGLLKRLRKEGAS